MEIWRKRNARDEARVSSFSIPLSFKPLLTVTEFHVRKHCTRFVPGLARDDSVGKRTDGMSRSSHCKKKERKIRSSAHFSARGFDPTNGLS